MTATRMAALAVLAIAAAGCGDVSPPPPPPVAISAATATTMATTAPPARVDYLESQVADLTERLENAEAALLEDAEAALLWWVTSAGDDPTAVDISAAVAGLVTTTTTPKTPTSLSPIPTPPEPCGLLDDELQMLDDLMNQAIPQAQADILELANQFPVGSSERLLYETKAAEIPIHFKRSFLEQSAALKLAAAEAGESHAYC